jgi:hypothetical protein
MPIDFPEEIKMILARVPQEKLRPRVKLQENKGLSQEQERLSVSLKVILAM